MKRRLNRQTRGTHSSMNLSGLDVIEEEVRGMKSDLENLNKLLHEFGTSNDTPSLRQRVFELKDLIADEEQSILSRLKIEVQSDEVERHEDLEDSFFELKTQYYSVLGLFNEKHFQYPQPVAADIPQEQPQYQQPQYEQPQQYSQPQYQQPIYEQPQYTQQPQYQQPQYEQPQQYSQPQYQYEQQQFQQPSMSSPPISRHTKPLPPPPSNSPYAIEPNFAPPPYEQYNLYSEQENAPVWLQEQLREEGAFDVNGVQLVERDSVYWNTKEVEQRNQEMQFIGSEMVHLTEIFQDVAREVDVQAEQIAVVDETVETAQENTKEAVKTMGKSAKNANKVLLPGVGGGIGVLTGAVVGGVIGTAAGGMIIPGIVVGAAIGAGLGGGMGAGAGKVLRNNTDKEMHKARLNDAWQPDKLSKNCHSCKKKFTQVLRRHHCRNCGLCFCDHCTKHKMHIPGVEGSGRQRVCAKCFEAIMYFNQGVAPSPSFIQSLEPAPSPAPLPAPPQKEPELVVYGGDVNYEGGPGF